MKNSIVHFEIPVDNVARAKKFYEEVFGWSISKFDMPTGDEYFAVRTTEVDKNNMPTSPGINGGMMKRKDSGQVFMNYINVDSIDKTIEALKKHHAKICMPKTEIAPGMGWIAIFQDTENTMLGLHETPPAWKEKMSKA